MTNGNSFLFGAIIKRKSPYFWEEVVVSGPTTATLSLLNGLSLFQVFESLSKGKRGIVRANREYCSRRKYSSLKMNKFTQTNYHFITHVIFIFDIFDE